MPSYTPTLTNISNLSNSVAREVTYIDRDNVLTVAGQLDIYPSSLNSCALEMSLPIPVEFSSVYQLGGSGATDDQTSNAVEIFGNVSTQSAAFFVKASSTAGQTISFVFMCRKADRFQYSYLGKMATIGDSISNYWPLTTYFPDGMINAGIPGDFTSGMIVRLQADVLSHQPKIVIIQGGTNDVRFTAGAVPDNILTMAQAIEQYGAKPILCQLCPANDWSSDPAYTAHNYMDGDALIRAWNAAVVAMGAAHGWPVVDFHTPMLNPDGTQNASLFTGTVHPNAAGYAVMAQQMNAVLDQQ